MQSTEMQTQMENTSPCSQETVHHILLLFFLHSSLFIYFF